MRKLNPLKPVLVAEVTIEKQLKKPAKKNVTNITKKTHLKLCKTLLIWRAVRVLNLRILEEPPNKLSKHKTLELIWLFKNSIQIQSRSALKLATARILYWLAHIKIWSYWLVLICSQNSYLCEDILRFQRTWCKYNTNTSSYKIKKFGTPKWRFFKQDGYWLWGLWLLYATKT